MKLRKEIKFTYKRKEYTIPKGYVYEPTTKRKWYKFWVNTEEDKVIEDYKRRFKKLMDKK